MHRPSLADKADRERAGAVARAIARRVKRKEPLDLSALALEAICYAEKGASYFDFMRRMNPEGASLVHRAFADEARRQLKSTEAVDA